MKPNKIIFLSVFIGLFFGPASADLPAAERLRMATTTSTENSGLLAILNPPFEKKFGVSVDVIAVGTGKALRIGANGDVDIVFVHAPGVEQAFVDAGHGIDRQPVMHNDFVILGPRNDPAGLQQASTTTDALRSIARSQSLFVSRGDDSGTHKKEQTLWQLAGVVPDGQWYVSAGQGMGSVLRIADERNAYVLSDRGTYLAYAGEIALGPVFERDPPLFNPYHVIAVNPARHPHVRYALARRYIGYVTGSEGQAIIANYKKNGQVLFYPDAVRAPETQ